MSFAIVPDESLNVLLTTGGMQGDGSAGIFFMGPFHKTILRWRMMRADQDRLLYA